MFFKTIVPMLFGVLLVSCVATEGYAQTLIDDFSTGAIVVSRTDENPATADQQGLDPTKVLGGARHISVGEFSSTTQTMTIDTNQEQMIFETKDNARGYFDIDYGSEVSPLNLDLTADGSDAFLIDVNDHLLRVTIRIMSETEESSLSTSSFGVTTFPLPNGLTRAILPYDEFFNITDLSNIQKIMLTVGRFPSSTTLIVGQFSTVSIPEPSTCVMGCGFIAFFFCKRRTAMAI